MRQRPPQTIDMTPAGEFRAVPDSFGPKLGAWPVRLGIGAAAVAAIAGAVALAAIFLWVASVLLPVALVAGAVAYAAFRFQGWRARQQAR